MTLCLRINTRFGTPSLDLSFPSSMRYKSSSCFCSMSLCAALIPTFQFSALTYPLGSVPLWSISVLSFQMNLPFSKFRFYLCALCKTPAPVRWKIYFTLPSLTSMGLMVPSSTCSSVVLIEAHWLHESSPKICSFSDWPWVPRKASTSSDNAAHHPNIVPGWGWQPRCSVLAALWSPSFILLTPKALCFVSVCSFC